MRKPDAVIYGADDRPPALVVVALAVQHVTVLSIFLIGPVLVARAAHLPTRQADDFISLTLIALSFGTFLQVARLGPVGSGLLAIPTSSSNWVPGCLIVAREGGLPAVAALLWVAAVMEVLLSRFLRPLRALLPTELSGLVVFVTGLGVAQTGMDSIVYGITEGNAVHWLPSSVVSFGTLGFIAGLSVWGRGPLGTMAVVLGLIFGYVASLATGVLDPASLQVLSREPLIRVPSFAPVLPSFDVTLILPSTITGLVIILNSIGALTAAQKLNDADWHRQDLGGLSRGLLADALAVAMSGLFGGGGISVSGSAVSLTAAARATSRTIGYAVAAGFLILSIVPRFAALMLNAPPPVLGAVLVFLSCPLIISGISIISSRLLDTRKTITLGIAFAFAFATSALVRAEPLLPYWMAPVVASPLLASAFIAILLNPVLRFGIRKQVELVLPGGQVSYDDVAKSLARAGAAWGARRDVIERAQAPIAECLDTVADAGLASGPVRLVLGFNELQLDARITWRGLPLHLSDTPPTKEELMGDDGAASRMAGYLIGKLVSRVRSRFANGVAEVHLLFDH